MVVADHKVVSFYFFRQQMSCLLRNLSVHYGAISLCNYLSFFSSASLLDPGILLTTLLSSSLIFCSSLIMRDCVSHKHQIRNDL